MGIQRKTSTCDVTTRQNRGGNQTRHALACAALTVILIASSSGSPAWADPSASDAKLTFTTERVVVFKDGYCLVVKHAEGVTNERAELFTDEVPDAAVLGSFWAAPSQGRLLGMTAGWTKVDRQVTKDAVCTETIEILQANRGQEATVRLTDKTVIRGTIHRVLAHETTAALAPPLRDLFGLSFTPGARPAASLVSSAMPAGTVAEPTVTSLAGSQFVLRTEDGDVLLRVNQVDTLTIPDMTTVLSRTATVAESTKRLTFRFDEPNVPRRVTLMYFRPGIRWIPTYRIHLEPNGQKQIAAVDMQAELLNEAEDLVDVPLSVVVGVPNFRFRETPSPLVLESVMRNALRQAAPDLMNYGNNAMSNAMFSQRIGEVRRPGGDAAGEGGGLELPAELTAASSQDLFVYGLPRLTLRKGDRAAVPIFSATAPYRDVYTWDLHVKRAGVEAAPSGSGITSPLALLKNEIWHQIEVTNNTEVPWTTGAAMIMQDGQPLAQELLTYTSPRREVRVPVTVSVDTRGSFEESEVGRQLRALNWDHHDYAQIDKQTSLELVNNKPIDIHVEVRLQAGGRVTAASDDGQITIQPFEPGDWDKYIGSPAVNNSSTVVWRTTIPAGAAFTPTVNYRYYARM